MTKTKSQRNALTKKKGTLDQKHTENITRFEKMGQSLPSKKEKLAKLESELKTLMDMNPNKYTHQDVRRKAFIMDFIDRLRSEINSIENCTESLNYIVDTMQILIDYYDNENDSESEEAMIDDNNDTGKKTILSYFIQQSSKNGENGENIENEENANPNAKMASGSKRNTGSKDTDKDVTKRRTNKAKLYDNYLAIIDTTYRKNPQKRSNMCSREDCDGEKILSQNDGYLVCKKCGISEMALVSVDKPNYKEPTQDSGTYAYKRINHLTEILSQLQAKESTDIPPKVFESILRELKKRKIDKYDLDIFRLRRILKKLNYRKYYEHVPHILQIINGKEPPNFTRKDEMKIKKMFRDVQKPFSIYCPKNRKNFLNYSYVLHKFCELLDLDEYISYFPLLKNNAKLLQHDKIWKNICKYMKWEYYKSI